MGLFGNDVELKNAELDCSPQNEYATEETVAKVDDALDAGEKVHFLARGTGGGVDVEAAGAGLFGGDGTRILGTMGDVRTAATDRRVLLKIPRALGSDVRSIPYREVTDAEVDLEGVHRRLSVLTAERTYHVDVDALSSEDCREMATFVREKGSEAGDNGSAEEDKTDRDDDPDDDLDAEPETDQDDDLDAEPETDQDDDLDAEPETDQDVEAGPDMVKS